MTLFSNARYLKPTVVENKIKNFRMINICVFYTFGRAHRELASNP